MQSASDDADTSARSSTRRGITRFVQRNPDARPFLAFFFVAEVASARDFRGSQSAMLSKVWSAATLGIDATRIIVEVDGGSYAALPGFTLVGLPDAAVREAFSRFRSALHHCGLWMPPRRITVNL